MNIFKVKLKEHYKVMGGELDCVLRDRALSVETTSADFRRPAVIVVPGGNYWFVSKSEGEPVADYFRNRGFQTFVLTYLTVGMFDANERKNECFYWVDEKDAEEIDEVCYPEHLIELGAAVDYVRKHADEFMVNPDEIFVVGFSAGGHLVADLAVEYASVGEKAGQALDCKPTAIGLGYPVITNKEAFKGTHENLLRGYTQEAKVELLKTLNLDEAVSASTAPAFIWTMATDNLVPSANSLRFALALAGHGVPYELHVYPRGEHGISTGERSLHPYIPDEAVRTARWKDDCVEFFKLFISEKI
ncbi:MAG: alpha/beta hydrolase [Clostridia bacterium]|nr:alpha/beta hydrolase [Clostridia bacterium]